MATLTIPVTLVPGTNENISDVKTNFDAVATTVNSIDDANISAAAAIQESKIATGVNGFAKGAFSSYRAAAQALTSTNVVNFDTELFDVSGWHDIVTNVGRYTPQVAGYYRLSWMVTFSTVMTAGKAIQSYLRKNAAALHAGTGMVYGGAFIGVCSTGSVVVQANGTTDFFDIRVDHDNGGTLAVVTGTGPTFTHFHGEMIGRS